MHQLGEVLLSGAIIGSSYAMMAMGMSLAYGISRVFNFAYGSFYILAGFLAYTLLGWGFSFPVTFALVLPAMFGLGFAIERGALRPLRARPDWEMTVVMATLGFALLIDHLNLAIFGPFAVSLPQLAEGYVRVAGFTIARHDIVVAATSGSLIIGLWMFLNRTRQGLAMQAVAMDITGAQVVGIPRDRMFSITFGLACVLVGLGGLLLGSKYFIHYLHGWTIMVKAWVITAFGGMGNVLGAITAAFILGMVEVLVGWQFGLTWSMVGWFVAMIGMFIFRPQGLLGTWG